jgi:hypothetical protein
MTPLRMALWQRDREGCPTQPGELIPGDVVTFESPSGCALRAEVFRYATEDEFRQAAQIAGWVVSRFRDDGPWFWVEVEPARWWLRPVSALRRVDAEAEVDEFLEGLFGGSGSAS